MPLSWLFSRFNRDFSTGYSSFYIGSRNQHEPKLYISIRDVTSYGYNKTHVKFQCIAKEE